MKAKNKWMPVLVSALLLMQTGTAAFARDSRVISPPVSAAADAMKIRKAFRLEKDPLVSMVLENQPVQTVLQGLARKAGLGLIFMSDSSAAAALDAAAPAADDPLLDLESEVSGNSGATSGPIAPSRGGGMKIPYMELNKVPVSEAFALVLQMSGLSARRVYDQIIIASPERMTELGFDSPVIKTYTIYNQLPQQVIPAGVSLSQNQIQAIQAQQPPQSQGDSIMVVPTRIEMQLARIYETRKIRPLPEMVMDQRTSTLIIIGTQEAIDIADEMLPILDRPLSQVVIEIKLLELTKRASQELGLSYGFGQEKVGASFNANDPNGLGPGNPVTGQGEGVISFNSLSRFAPNFNARLNALIQDSQARVLTNPRLTIQHGVEASFNSTTNVPILSTTTTATTTTQTVQQLAIGEQLQITPFIDESTRTVTMSLRPNISTRGNTVSVGTQSVPEQNTRNVETILRVKDGDSAVIGGLMRKIDNEQVSKIPLLGDIPILGSLFSTTSREKEDVEVVIIVTPRILENPIQ